MSSTKTKTPFWLDDPNVLFRDWSQLIPTGHQMTSNEQRMNAVTRLVILSTLLLTGYISFFSSSSLSSPLRILAIGICTIAVIALVYSSQKRAEPFVARRDMLSQSLDLAAGKEKVSSSSSSSSSSPSLLLESLEVFDTPTSKNPLSNALPSDVHADPPKKPAPPVSNDAILQKAMQLVQEQHPDHPDLAAKLFGSPTDRLAFEQSLRPFHSMPSTTIPNDQGSFAKFCFGDMISCKEGNAFACARNLYRYQN